MNRVLHSEAPTLRASASLRSVRSTLARLLALAALTLCFLFATAASSRAQGSSDIIWQNYYSGAVYEWNMTGTTIADSGYLSTGIDTSWQVVAQADLFNDGSTSLIWANTSSGDVYYWHLGADNRTILDSDFIEFGVDVSWHIVAVTYNAAHNANLIWENNYTGDVYYWTMSGTTIINSGYLYRAVSAPWTISAAGDIFGDGTTTLIWRNAYNGDVYYWHLGTNGITITSSGYLYNGVPTNWTIVGTADIDGNGTADLIWEDQFSNDVYYWAMSGATTINSGYLYRAVTNGWMIHAAGSRAKPATTLPKTMQAVSNAGGTFTVLAMDGLDNWLVNATTQWATRGVPTGLSDAMYAKASQVTGAAFDTLGNWVVIIGSNGYQSVGIPSGLVSALTSINSQSAQVHAVALGPNGGYAVAFGIGGYYTSNVPQGLVNALNSINANRQTVTAIALSASGGYAITWGVGGYSAQGVPQGLIDELNLANSNRWTVRAIALGGPTSYAIASSGRWAVSSTR